MDPETSAVACDDGIYLMATGGGLVFGGDVNARFRALDQETGEVLWEINLGSPVVGYPISYAVGGRQYVAGNTGAGIVNLLRAARSCPGNRRSGRFQQAHVTASHSTNARVRSRRW